MDLAHSERREGGEEGEEREEEEEEICNGGSETEVSLFVDSASVGIVPTVASR